MRVDRGQGTEDAQAVSCWGGQNRGRGKADVWSAGKTDVEVVEKK